MTRRWKKMHMRKRLTSVLLVLCLLLCMIPTTGVRASAATALGYAPYANVEYSYSADVTCGTIRYIGQTNKSGTYFDKRYWPTTTYEKYSGPGSECGTACISMALSYVGIDRKPNVILNASNQGVTNFGSNAGWNLGGAKLSEPSLSTAINNYLNGDGKYSPPIIHLTSKYNHTGYKSYTLGKYGDGYTHYLLIVGQISSDEYLVLDPAQGYTPGTTFPIKKSSDFYKNIADVKQYYNPNATTLVKNTYPAYCAIKVSSDNTYIKSLPCSEKTDPNSANVEVAQKGAQYQAIGLVENRAGNLWYKVRAKSGGEGYMYAGDTTYLAQSINDIKADGVKVPSNHTAGKVYVLTGSIKSTYNQLTGVSAYVYSGSNEQGTKVTGATASVTGNSYKLGGSSIDNKTEFNKLAAGTYTYIVSASYKNYYAKSATVVGTNTGTISVYKANFNVVSGTVSCSHSYSSKVTTAATCTDNGVRTYTCSKCNAGYTESIPATGHSYSYRATTVPTATAAGGLTGTCSKCSGTTAVTLPKLDTTNYTYQVVKEPSYTQTGTGRYTWKTTTYGSIYFEVTLEKLQEEVKPNAPQMVISQAAARPGQSVSVEVSLQNNPGINTFTLSIEYDHSKLVLESVTPAAALTGTFMYSEKTSAVGWQAASDSKVNGTILTLNFTVKEAVEAAELPISISYKPGNICNYDEEDVDFQIVDGCIKVTEYMPGDINGDGVVNNKDLNRLMKYLLDDTTEVSAAALDVNGDGSINNKDLNRLMKYLLDNTVEIY